MAIFVSWIFLSFIIGFIGDSRKIGFTGAFFVCILLSPLLGIIVVLSSKRKSDEEWQKEILKNSTSKESVTSVADEIEKLIHLKENGSISEEEFDNLKRKLINS